MISLGIGLIYVACLANVERIDVSRQQPMGNCHKTWSGRSKGEKKGKDIVSYLKPDATSKLSLLKEGVAKFLS